VAANTEMKPKTLLPIRYSRYLENRESAKTNSPIIEAERITAIKTSKSRLREEKVTALVLDISRVNVAGIKKVNIANATEATLGLNQEP
jgi:hypothetical protein